MKSTTFIADKKYSGNLVTFKKEVKTISAGQSITKTGNLYVSSNKPILCNGATLTFLCANGAYTLTAIEDSAILVWEFE
jgi:hypothetical protein